MAHITAALSAAQGLRAKIDGLTGDSSAARGRDLTDGEQKDAREARQQVHSNDQMYALPIDELTGL